MQNAMSGMVRVMRKTNARITELDGMDDDVKGWLLNEYAGDDGEDDSKLSKRSKRNQKSINPEEISTSALFSWDFCSLDKSEEDLVGICVRVFKELKMVEIFELDEAKLRRFVMGVRTRYNKNPFHNWKHAVMVLHTTYLFITQVAAEFCTDLEVLSLLVAALCHDCDHNGMNNAFHINSRSDLALLCMLDLLRALLGFTSRCLCSLDNDQSVLENHHCFSGFDVLFEKGNNFLDGLADGDYKRFRSLVIDCILGETLCRSRHRCYQLKQS
jgi:3',5'-cyclic-nucleotide phosphodiesterase